MANNTTLNSMTGGDVIADEDVSGVKYQLVKLVDATSTSTTRTGVAANPIQVSLANTAANSTAVKVDNSAVTQPVSGTVTAVSGTAANLLSQVSGTVTAVSGTAANLLSTVSQGTATNLKSQAECYQGGSAVATGNPLQVTLANGSVPSHAVTNAGTFAVQATVAAAATNIAKAEDVASADADVGVPALAVRKATPANTSGTDGDYEFIQMSAGRLWTSTVVDTALPAGTNAIGTVTAVSGTAANLLAQVSGTVTAVSGTAANLLSQVSGSVTATSGTAANFLSTVSGTVTAVSGTAANLLSQVSGTVTATSGTAANFLMTDSVTNQTGKTIKLAYSASQTAATVLTPTSGKIVVITDIVISATGAGTVYIFDSTDSSTTNICPTLSLAANGGWNSNFRKPWVSAAANNVIKYTSGAGAAGSIWFQYYEI